MPSRYNTARIPYACLIYGAVLHACCRQVKVTDPEALPALVCIMTWSELGARASREPHYLLLLFLHIFLAFFFSNPRASFICCLSQFSMARKIKQLRDCIGNSHLSLWRCPNVAINNYRKSKKFRIFWKIIHLWP